MSREIKFRAWDKEKKQMLPWTKLEFSKFDETVWTDYRPFELMQYTGLKDKNGVEIYEGDIVAVNAEEGPSKTATVEFLPHDMWYLAGEVQDGMSDVNEYCYIEVIGNIYENPELLDAMKEATT